MQSFSEASSGLGPTSLANAGCSGQVRTDYSLLLSYSGQKPRLLISQRVGGVCGVKREVSQETETSGSSRKSPALVAVTPGPGRYLY